MIMVLCFAALVGGIAWCIKNDGSVWQDATSFLLALFGGAGSVACLVVWCIYNVGVEGTAVANLRRHEMLTYQLESDMYDNDNDIGKKELMNQITEWNSSLAWYKTNQRNFWIGVFIPNVYDQFDYIQVGGIGNDG